MDTTDVNKAVSNGIPPPSFELPIPDKQELITENMYKLNTLADSPRTQFLMNSLVKHLHGYIRETSLTTEEWMTTIQFLTRTGQMCDDIRQEFILLSDVLGVSALVDALNNPPAGNATESSVLGPFFTEDAPDVANGDSIASEGKGDYLWVEGRVLDTKGTPIPDVVIETWETDSHGFYDNQYKNRVKPDCRGRLHSDQDGKFAYRAVVPVAYPIPGDGPVGELLNHLRRHNMRPNHLHMMFDKSGFRRLTTALYPEGDPYNFSDAVFGVKRSLVIKLDTVTSESEARAKGFAKNETFKVVKRDFIMQTEDEAKDAREQYAHDVGAVGL